jgi:serine/threonine kinase 38
MCYRSATAEKSLSYHALQEHPFFAGVDWDALEKEEAPYVPTVTHELDTQNFEEFEEKEPASATAGTRRRLQADPNFIGYTYKNWEAISPREGRFKVLGLVLRNMHSPPTMHKQCRLHGYTHILTTTVCTGRLAACE